MEEIGRILLVVGLLIAGMGLFLVLFDRVSWFGSLPGDIYYEGDNVTFYFPLTTSLIISLLLSLLLLFIQRM